MFIQFKQQFYAFKSIIKFYIFQIFNVLFYYYQKIYFISWKLIYS